MEEILHSGCHSVVDTTVWGTVNWIRQPDKVKNNANEKGSGEGTIFYGRGKVLDFFPELSCALHWLSPPPGQQLQYLSNPS